MSDTANPQPPTTVGASVVFNGGRSGEPVIVTKQSDDLFIVTLPASPEYVAALIREGRDSYILQPQTPPGAGALGAIGINWADIVELF